MEMKQHLKLSQQLVMTPQLQQAIKLLQMSRLELAEMVAEQLLENPMLEDVADDRPVSSELLDRSGGDGRTEARSESTIPDANNEIDWERYIDQHANRPTDLFRSTVGSIDGTYSPESNYSESEGLTEHLLWQLQMGEFLAVEKEFAALVIGNLDDNGYLKLEGVEPSEVVPRLAQEVGLDEEDAEEVLQLIQQFDPIGVASRTLQECLVTQAKHLEMDSLVIDVIEHHLHDLENRRYDRLAAAIDRDVEEVYDIAQVIADLEPRPARRFQTEPPRYFVPDVYVNRVGDEYFVVVNDDGMPKLKISNTYTKAIRGDARAKEYVQDKMRSAQWLIRSIDQRRKTIERVTECIVARQRDFFEVGIEHLKPMVLRDVADEIGMHESTVSRVTNNKYVHTPRGTFELKFFFNSAIRRDGDSDIASESVKQAIAKIISAEDSKLPLSDQHIVEVLAQDSIQIARRTVAKYREALGILSSSKRKKYF